MQSVKEKREEYGEFVEGLGTRDSAKICAAAYLYSEFDGFDSLDDDYEYDHGYGVISPSLLQSLPAVFDAAERREPDDSEAFEVGRFFKQFDNITELALYHYSKEREEIPNGLQMKLNELDEEVLEEELEELKRELRTRS